MSRTALITDPRTIHKEKKQTVRRQKVKPGRVPLAHTQRKQAAEQSVSGAGNVDHAIERQISVADSKSSLDQTSARIQLQANIR